MAPTGATAGVGQRSRRAFLGAAAMLALAPAPARAVGFLEGADVELLVPSAAGSAADRLARGFAAGVESLVTGLRVAVRNDPRGDGRLAALALWQAAPDGRIWAFLSSNLFYSTLLEAAELPFRLDGFTWIGSLAPDRRVLLATAAAGLPDIAALRAAPATVLLATESRTSTNYREALLVNALLGCRIRPVTGYDGSARALAALAGEVQCLIGTYEAMTPLLEPAAGLILLRINDCVLPPPHAAPWLGELAAPADAWVLELIRAQSSMGRCLATAPGTPDDLAAALRALFPRVLATPQFLAAAGDLELAPLPGDELARRLSAALAAGSELGPRLAEVLAAGERLAG